MKKKAYEEKAQRHYGDRQLLSDTCCVIYRTIREDNKISHIHAPSMAGVINWTGRKEAIQITDYMDDDHIDCYLGYPYDYIIVPTNQANPVIRKQLMEIKNREK